MKADYDCLLSRLDHIKTVNSLMELPHLKRKANNISLETILAHIASLKYLETFGEDIAV